MTPYRSESEQAGIDELKSLLAGGIIASVLAYVAVRTAYPCLGPPFALLGEWTDRILNLGGELIWWGALVVILFSGYIVLLALGYALADISGWKKGILFYKTANWTFYFAVVVTILFGFLVSLRFAEYWFLTGFNHNYAIAEVMLCQKSLPR